MKRSSPVRTTTPRRRDRTREAARSALAEALRESRAVGAPSRVLLQLLGVAAAGIAVPSFAAADGQGGAPASVAPAAPAPAPTVTTVVTPAPASAGPGATSPAAPAPAPATASVPATAPAISSAPGHSGTSTHSPAPKVRRQFAQGGAGTGVAHRHTTVTHRPSPASHARPAPALHAPTSPPPPPGSVASPLPGAGTTALLAPGVAPSQASAALLGQQAPPDAVNATLGFFRIPVFLLPIFQAAGDQYDVPWQVLAAINEVETNYGYDLAVSSAGAEGWMQFMPETWKLFGTDPIGAGYADPYNPADAIFAAARYLRDAGARNDIRGAIYAYNHSTAYVDSVMLRAKLIQVYPQAMIDQLTNLSIGVSPVQGSDPGQLTSQPAAPVPAPAGGSSSTPSVGGLAALSPSMRAAINASLALHSGTALQSMDARPLAPVGSSLPQLGNGAAPPVTPAAAPAPAPAQGAQTPAASGGAVALHTRGGSDVVAVKDSKVVRAGTSRRLGGYVTLRDAQGDLFVYGHLARIGTRAPSGVTTAPATRAAGRAARVAAVPPAAAAVAANRGGADSQALASNQLQIGSGPHALQVTVPGTALSGTPANDAGGPRWNPVGTQAPPVSGALRMLGYATLASEPPPSTVASLGLPSWSTPVSSGWLPLRAGQTLWAGSVLGQAPASGVVRFAVRPAGDPRSVDPRPFLSAWHLRREVLDPASVLAQAAGDASGGAGSGVVGAGAAVSGAGGALSPGPSATTGLSNPALGRPASLTASLLAKPAATTTAGATASAAVSHRTPPAPLRYDLTTWGQDRVFFLSRAQLEREVLTDRRVQVFTCGRQQIAQHRVDHRVLAVVEYLADSGLHPTISALGCPAAAASSAALDTAVDVSRVDGVPVAGHQGAGSITDLTVHRLMSLPSGYQPSQIATLISYPQASNTVARPTQTDSIHLEFASPGQATGANGSQASHLAGAAAVGHAAPLPSLNLLSQPAPGLTPQQWQRLARHLQSNGNPLLVASPSSAAVPR